MRPLSLPSIAAGAWDVPLPEDMEALVESLLQEYSLGKGSAYCSAAFQTDLQSFLNTQVNFRLVFFKAW